MDKIPYYQEMIQVMQYVIVLIFLVLVTLFVGFNRKMYLRFSGDNSKKMTWLFILFMTPLLCVVLFVFGIIFGKVDFGLLFRVLTGKA